MAHGKSLLLRQRKLPPDVDDVFFAQHGDRRIRIREPELGRSSEETECEDEFRTLGPHEKRRRRIIVARVSQMAAAMMGHPKLRTMKIPFLLFGDETVEDRDDILLPILDEIMRNAAKDQGILRRH